jgi:hypothetical protein
MPEEEKKTVPIDTSGPDATVDIEEEKDESVVETETPKQETENTDQGTDKTFENERETKLEEKKSDDKLEEYSKGVQARIGKLTRKLREAERREQAALDYAKGVEKSKNELESKFQKTDSDYIKKFESTISSGLEAAQKELAAAIEAGDAKAQVEANKRIATLAFENAKLEEAKQGREVKTQAQQPVTNLSHTLLLRYIRILLKKKGMILALTSIMLKLIKEYELTSLINLIKMRISKRPLPFRRLLQRQEV